MESEKKEKKRGRPAKAKPDTSKHPLLAGKLNGATEELRGYRRERVVSQIQTTTLVNMLQEHAAGEREMETTQIQAARILLDRTIPTLSSVEQVHVNEQDQLTEAQLVAKLQALIAARPELLDKLIDARAQVARVINNDSVSE